VADANTVIRDLGQQIAQLTVDKTIALVELGEARERIAELEDAAAAEDLTTCEPAVKP
jgi:hypothetical protein